MRKMTCCWSKNEQLKTCEEVVMRPKEEVSLEKSVVASVCYISVFSTEN